MGLLVLNSSFHIGLDSKYRNIEFMGLFCDELTIWNSELNRI